MIPTQGIQEYMVDKVTGSTLTRTFASVKQVCLKEVSLSDFHPKQTLPKLKAHTFHAECCCDVIVGCNVLQAFGTQIDFKDGWLVCDGVSVHVCKFPNDASEATPTEHLLCDCLDHNEENDKDGLSFDDNFAVETLDGFVHSLHP